MATTAYQSGYTGAQIDAAIGAVPNKADKIQEVNHGTSDTTFTLTANTMHIWGTVTSLTLSLPTDSNSVLDEFMFTFTSGSTPTTLSLPSSVKWVQDISVEANKTYQVSIINNLAGWLTNGMPAGGGGGGGEANVIESISVNGTPQTVTNKNVDISVPTEITVTNWGFTKNAGTITGINMNGVSKGTSGVVDLGTVITDVSGKAEKSEMSVVAGTDANADKTTITLKTGTSATVLTTHQDISGKANASDVTTLQGYFTNGVANSAATASTASALAASKTLWGQSFDGTANVSGNMTGVGSITASDNIYLANAKHIYAKDSGNTNRSLLALSSSNTLMLGYGLASTGSTYIYGNSITVRIGGTAAENNAVVINSSGNTTLSGTLTIGDCEISYANNKLNFSNGVVAVFSGSTAPSSSTGSDGDIYIQTS